MNAFLQDPTFLAGLSVMGGADPGQALQAAQLNAAQIQRQQMAAEQEKYAMERQAQLDELMRRVGPQFASGNVPPEVLAQIMSTHPEFGMQIMKALKGRTPKITVNPVTGEYVSIDNDAGTVMPVGIGGNAGEAVVSMPGGDVLPPSKEKTPEAFRMTPPPPGLTPKDKAAWNKKESERILKLRESAPTAIQNIEQTAQLIDQMLKHPGFEGSVGAKNISSLFGLKDDPFSGTDEAGFMSVLKQVQGKQFLTAFQELKGAGAITEKEGTKATEAYSRLSTATGEKEFKKASKELYGYLSKGYKRLTGKPLKLGELKAGEGANFKNVTLDDVRAERERRKNA
jgi:hypothetical protein